MKKPRRPAATNAVAEPKNKSAPGESEVADEGVELTMEPTVGLFGDERDEDFERF